MSIYQECISHGDDIFLVLAGVGGVLGLLGACLGCKTQPGSASHEASHLSHSLNSLLQGGYIGL